MAITYSTALLGDVAFHSSWRDALKFGKLEIRTGAPPGPDKAVSGTLLCTVTLAGATWTGLVGTGLDFSVDTGGGVISKDPAHVWQGTNLASGQAGHFRWVKNIADTGAADTTTYNRFEGVIATVGGDLNLTYINFEKDAIFLMPTATFTVPNP